MANPNARLSTVPLSEYKATDKERTPAPRAKDKDRPQITTVDQLRAKKFKVLRRIVGDFVLEGATMLAAAAKVGKTWLCLDACWAIATGGYTLGDLECTQGEALYLSLEQGERSIQRRLTKQRGLDLEQWPASFHVAYEWPRAHDGGIGELEAWLIKHRETARIIVIDTFTQFRTQTPDGKPNYQKDYDAVAALQKLATYYEVAIVILTHTRKADDGDDPLNRVLGSVGAVAAADAVLVLSMKGEQFTLYGRSRDAEAFNVAMEFQKDTCRWRIVGDRNKVDRERDRATIIAAVTNSTVAVSTADLIAAVGKSRSWVMSLLNSMVGSGELTKPSHGHYSLPREAAE